MKNGLIYAGVGGLTGIIIGAFGAHILRDSIIARESLSVWETAVFYHISHSIAALSVFLHAQTSHTHSGKWLARAGSAWLIGILLFSGSLYFLALGGPKWLGPITPLGGLFLMAGWACVIAAALKFEANK